MKFLLLSVTCLAVALVSCSTPPSPKAQVLLNKGEKILGGALTSALQNIVQQEVSNGGGKVDLAQAAAAGVWGAATAAVTSNDVKTAISSFSDHTMPQTTSAAGTVFDEAVRQGVPPDKAATAIANVISSVAASQSTP